jgi:hypothetical protein
MFTDVQHLTVAKCPASGREIEPRNRQHTYEGIHFELLPIEEIFGWINETCQLVVSTCCASDATGGLALRLNECGRRGLWSETLKQERRHWSADHKIRLLRLHLIEKQAISKICQEASLSPSQFHACQEQ